MKYVVQLEADDATVGYAKTYYLCFFLALHLAREADKDELPSNIIIYDNPFMPAAAIQFITDPRPFWVKNPRNLRMVEIEPKLVTKQVGWKLK